MRGAPVASFTALQSILIAQRSEIPGEELMASMLIKGGRVLSPDDNLDGILDVRIEDGVIREIAPMPRF
jgi:hypothetical protein